VQGQVVALLRELGRNLRDLLPIVCVVALFQVLVIRQPMLEVDRRIGGAVFALVGLTLFVRALGMSIFPLGDGMADWLARRGSLLLLFGFGFALGFGSTVAEPALAAVADQAASAVAGTGTVGGEAGEIARFSLFLRYAVAIAVGIAVAVGVLRVVKGLAGHVVRSARICARISTGAGQPVAPFGDRLRRRRGGHFCDQHSIDAGAWSGTGSHDPRAKPVAGRFRSCGTGEPDSNAGNSYIFTICCVEWPKKS
jgi:Protein of unknown function (DUF1538)